MPLENNQQEPSIEDILSKINTAIKKKPTIASKPKIQPDYDLVELTNIVLSDGSVINAKNDNKNIDDKRNQLSNISISDNLLDESLLSSGVFMESAAESSVADNLNSAKATNKQEPGIKANKLETEIVKSLAQKWIDHNLPLIAREMLEKEIKGLIAKIKSN